MNQSDTGAPIAVGDTLAGKYRVDRILGIGGMGVVVAAMHVDLHELRAIKFMLPEMLANTQAVERFLREARAASRLKSEHVAKVHDVGRLENGAPYMVMEYLEGSDLSAVVKQRGPRPADEAVSFVLQACEAIAEAHALGIVHRDLKPANLFLSASADGTPCVKVLDFGISKVMGPPGSGMDMTKTSAILGSPLYMSPEQMQSTRDVDARTDIWALGVILYELLTGVVPFEAESITQLCAMVLQQEPAPPSGVRQGLPPGLDAVVLRCLEKRTASRYQNVGELAAALIGFGWADAQLSMQRISRMLGMPSNPPPQLAPSQPPPALVPPGPLALPQPASAAQSGMPPPGVATAAAWGQTGGNAPPKRSSKRAVVATLLGVGIGLGVIAAGIAVVVAHRAGGEPPAAALAAPSSQPTGAPEPPVPPAASNAVEEGPPAPAVASNKAAPPPAKEKAPLTKKTPAPPTPPPPTSRPLSTPAPTPAGHSFY